MSFAIASLVLFTALTPQAEPRSPAPQQPEKPPEERREPQPMPIPRTLILQKGDRTIEVDGNLQDWPALPPIRIDDPRQLSGTALGAWRSRDDLAARLFAMWDEDALYLAAVVLDDWHIRLTKESPRVLEIPPCDSLSIFIDPHRDTSRGIGIDRGREEDVCAWLADVEGQGDKVVGWDLYRGAAAFLPDARGRVGRNDERRTTVYELRLPWSDVLGSDQPPSARTVFDLQFIVDDLDEPTDPMPQTRIGWNFGMGTRIDPGLYGSAMLADVSSEDLGAGGFPMPSFPDPPERTVPLPPGREYWAGLRRRLRATEPTPIDRTVVDPSVAGGKERREVLFELDRQLGDFPRVDFLRLQMCVHRRMNRECEGFVAEGLPSFWQAILDDLEPELEAEAPRVGYRLLRLPQGGWLVRSRAATFAIDPAGYKLDRSLDDFVDFVLLTSPWDPSKRHDQLALRLLAGEPKRRVLQHVATHLPAFAAEDFEFVRPGERHQLRDVTVEVLGVLDADGHVSSTVGYHVRWPDGSDLVISALVLDEAKLTVEDPIEGLLLSARHPRARIVGQRCGARMVILDDVLQCAVSPGEAGRVRLEEAFALQTGLKPGRSLLLAPGESVDIAPKDD